MKLDSKINNDEEANYFWVLAVTVLICDMSYGLLSVLSQYYLILHIDHLLVCSRVTFDTHSTLILHISLLLLIQYIDMVTLLFEPWHLIKPMLFISKWLTEGQQVSNLSKDLGCWATTFLIQSLTPAHVSSHLVLIKLLYVFSAWSDASTKDVIRSLSG